MTRRAPRGRGSSLLRQTLDEHNRAAYREAILAGARQVLLGSRVADAKMTHIAQATGISVGTIYNYFDSKEAVFSALLEAEEARLYAMLKAPVESAPGLGRLEVILERLFAHLAENAPLMLAYLEVDSCRYQDEEQLRATRERFVELFAPPLRAAQAAGELREDLSVHTLAGALAGLVRDAVVRVSLEPDIDPPRLGKQLLTIFVQGARAS